MLQQKQSQVIDTELLDQRLNYFRSKYIQYIHIN